MAELVFLASGEAGFYCVTSVCHHCQAVAVGRCSVTDFAPPPAVSCCRQTFSCC